jgi:thiol-disulfide isomerase/thioredoxin
VGRIVAGAVDRVLDWAQGGGLGLGPHRSVCGESPRSDLELLTAAGVYRMVVEESAGGTDRFMRKFGFLAILWVGALCAEELAALKVGDPAPKLQTGKFLQGEPVKEFEKGKVYLVEFWATWCAPCKENVPHISELDKKFKDKGLVIIGQDVWEDDDDDVKKFIKEMGDKMTYRVALDDKSESEKGRMSVAWMDAAKETAVPMMFIVANNEVAWMGRPRFLKEKTLEEILAGKYDVKKAAQEYARKKEAEEKSNAAFEEFEKAVTAKEWDKAETSLQAMEKVETVNDEQDRPDIEMMRLKMNLKKEDMAAAEAAAKRLMEKDPQDADYHSSVAWQLAIQKGASKGLLEIAKKEGLRAVELSKGKDPDILDTMARVHFANGEKDEAVATEQKAIELAEEKAKSNYQKTLDAYKAGKLPE